MKKSVLGLILLLILFTTYTPKFDFNASSKFNIKNIHIENNSVIPTERVKKKLNYLFNENLFLLDLKKIEDSLKDEDFIESFSIKKIYPYTLKLTITERKPIAILQIKKSKFYISDKGNYIQFVKLDIFNNLPVAFGGKKYFYSFYKKLIQVKFPVEKIKSFYFFESKRWDLVLKDEKVIKLPVENYTLSLKNFMLSEGNVNFNNYKLFDYRIKDQLILN